MPGDFIISLIVFLFIRLWPSRALLLFDSISGSRQVSKICYCCSAAGAKVLIKLLCFSQTFCAALHTVGFPQLNGHSVSRPCSMKPPLTLKCCYLTCPFHSEATDAHTRIHVDAPYSRTARLSPLSDVYCLCKERPGTNPQSPNGDIGLPAMLPCPSPAS